MYPTTDPGLAVIILAGLVYFLPWIIAIGRDHHNRGAIAVLTTFLGWTGLGWIIALIWACTEVHARTHA